MDKFEQPIATQEISQAEIFKKKASEKVAVDIAETQKMLSETSLSDGDVLMSKLDVRGVAECQDRIKGYEVELKEIDAGTINPEYVLYEHADEDEKIGSIMEKVDPSSELGKVLAIKDEVARLSDDQQEYVRSYVDGLSRLRNIADQQTLGHDEATNVDLEHQKIALSTEMRRKRSETMASLGDQKKADELQTICSTYEKYTKLREFVRSGHAFSEGERPLHVENVETKTSVPSWYGQMNNLYADYKSVEQKSFPRDPEKKVEASTEVPKEHLEAKQETPAVIEKPEVSKISEQDAEALKKVRESLGIKSSPQEGPATDQKSKKTFVSPEAVNGYKTSIEKMSDNFRSLDRILRRRSDDGLAELIDDNEAGRLTSIMRQLGEKDIKGQNNFEEISLLFTRLTDTVESIGTYRSRNVSDSVDSLKTVANALMMMGEGSQDVARQLKGMETPEAVQASKKADRLADTIFDRRMAMLRRMDQVGEYAGR